MRRARSRPTTVLTALTALLGASLTTGPIGDALSEAPCGLPRAAVHHSEGLDSWNADYPEAVGTVSALMAFLSFPDAAASTPPEVIAADYFPGTSEFFHTASYGRLDLRVDLAARWLPMPADSTSYGIRRDWEPELRAAYLRDALATLDGEVDLGRYDIVYLVADPAAPGVDPDATKVVNFDQPVTVGDAAVHRVVTLFEHRPPDPGVLAHETGHVFDLPDLYRRPPSGTGDWDTHVGDWDLMGSQYGLAPEPFGWHKWKLGWFDPGHVDCVTAPGTTRHTLQPLGAPLGAPPVAPLGGARSEADTRIAVVRTGPGEALVAEARTATGNDDEACTSGVLLYRVRSDVASTEGPITVLDGHPTTSACHGTSVYPRLADAPLRTGESYHDPVSGVRVQVGARTAAGGWRITIDNDEPGTAPAAS